MTEEHKHYWKRSPRKHGNPGRFFVVCDCGVERQAVMQHGHLHTFHTGSERGGQSRVVSYRLKPWQDETLKRKGLTFVQFVDEAFEVRKQSTL